MMKTPAVIWTVLETSPRELGFLLVKLILGSLPCNSICMSQYIRLQDPKTVSELELYIQISLQVQTQPL